MTHEEERAGRLERSVRRAADTLARKDDRLPLDVLRFVLAHPGYIQNDFQYRVRVAYGFDPLFVS